MQIIFCGDISAVLTRMKDFDTRHNEAEFRQSRPRRNSTVRLIRDEHVSATGSGFHRPNSRRSPGEIPRRIDVPAFSSSTQRTGPLEEMTLREYGVVAWAILTIRPFSAAKTMSRGIGVFFIHIDTGFWTLKSKSIPAPASNFWRFCNPMDLSSSVDAISTEMTNRPPCVTTATSPDLNAAADSANNTDAKKYKNNPAKVRFIPLP